MFVGLCLWSLTRFVAVGLHRVHNSMSCNKNNGNDKHKINCFNGDIECVYFMCLVLLFCFAFFLLLSFFLFVSLTSNQLNQYILFVLNHSDLYLNFLYFDINHSFFVSNVSFLFRCNFYHHHIYSNYKIPLLNQYNMHDKNVDKKTAISTNKTSKGDTGQKKARQTAKQKIHS